MTDRELLELAAKAAGLNVRWHDSGHYGPTMEIMECVAGGPPWNPLTDDGDALRLAVKLGIEHKKPSRSRSVGRVVQAWFPPDGNRQRAAVAHVSVTIDGDVLAATRRAIVRAAAEIGKAQP